MYGLVCEWVCLCVRVRERVSEHYSIIIIDSSLLSLKYIILVNATALGRANPAARSIGAIGQL